MITGINWRGYLIVGMAIALLGLVHDLLLLAGIEFRMFTYLMVGLGLIYFLLSILAIILMNHHNYPRARYGLPILYCVSYIVLMFIGVLIAADFVSVSLPLTIVGMICSIAIVGFALFGLTENKSKNKCNAHHD